LFHPLYNVFDWYLAVDRDVGNFLSLLQFKLLDLVLNVKVELLDVHQFLLFALERVFGQHHLLLFEL
jgi:hypothetical protein